MNGPVDSLILVGGLSIFTCVLFGGLLGGIRREGGRVRAKTYGFPELLISLVLAGSFLALVVKTTLRPDTADAPKVMLDQVLPNAAVFATMFIGIALFLRIRGIDITRALGLDRVPVVRGLAIGFGLILAAFPLVLGSGLIMQAVLRQEAQEQELVTLFRQVAHESDRFAVAQIFFAGAVVAPICEEFLFRGFFYIVFKRYFGAVASALLTSALFAAFHVNLAAFPSLFLLALCFVIAFETTGSLLVPITMHAIFNGAQLGWLYYMTRAGIAG